jgi:hypothetical protein
VTGGIEEVRRPLTGAQTRRPLPEGRGGHFGEGKPSAVAAVRGRRSSIPVGVSSS